MARTVFFSFHYKDIFRVQIVKNHYVTKGGYTASGFFDYSLEEKARTEGDAAVKRVIDSSLDDRVSVTCVLIGSETYSRRWVRYEILKSVELGKGMFGIRIHNIPDPRLGVDSAGHNPFQFVGYGTLPGILRPLVVSDEKWLDHPYLSRISNPVAKYMKGRTEPFRLDEIPLKVYDWNANNGYLNFGSWVEEAARQAGK